MELKKIYRIGFLIVVPIFFGYLIFRVRKILIPLALAAVMAYLLNPLVNWFQKRNISRGVAILIVYVFVFGAITSIVVLGVPMIMEELSSLGGAVPKLTSEAQMILNDAEAKYDRFSLPKPIKQVFDENIKLVEERLVAGLGGLAQGVVNLFSHTFSLLIAPIFAFYLLKDIGSIKKGLLNLMPVGWRSDVQAIAIEVNEIFSKYIRGHLTVCCIVGILTAVGYGIIGLDYAVLLGFFAGVADLIPYFGPIVGALPAVMLALLQSKVMVIKVVIVVLVIQQLENMVISPKILGDSLGLSPIVIIIALMAGGELYGLVGLLLAVPVAAILKFLTEYLYLKLVD